MSFQFPANPADGDIVVRGNLLATYKQDTNTWEVGEIPTYPGVPGPVGPQGPQGVQGNPGSGVNVTAIVDTFDDLPVDPETGSFIVVADTNTLYYWDGTKYYDLGSPIQGPKGDQGETGDTGSSGINGVDGRGWYDTAIDTSNGEYKVTFLSNDGLQFTTDDLKGGSWEPVYATATTPGLVKLGRGLNLTDEGTVETKDTYVQIETVPLGGADNTSFALNFAPSYLNWVDTKQTSAQQFNSSTGSAVQNGSMIIPRNSNGAIVYYYTGSASAPFFNAPGGYGLNWTCYASLTAILDVAGAVFANGGTTLGIPMTHNYSIGDEKRRTSASPVTKIGQIIYPAGTRSLAFTHTVTLQAIQRSTIQYGRGRVVLVPYLDSDGQAQLDDGTFPNVEEAYNRFKRLSVFDTVDVENQIDQLPEPPTAEDVKNEQANELRQALQYTLSAIDTAVVQTHPSGSVYDDLMSTRAELANLVNLPGTIDQIWDEYDRLAAMVNPYISFNFRFEV